MPNGERGFLSLARRVAQRSGLEGMLPVIEKELLHYEIFQALDDARLLERLTFQGGTCLRLCYGSERYSEDLDFAGGSAFDFEDATAIKEVVGEAIARRYDVTVSISDLVLRTHPDDPVAVSRWNIKVVTAPSRSDIPAQRVSIEIAAVPAHTRAVHGLQVNYEELPQSYGDILVQAETVEEICADKLKAFVTPPYLRYRDLWDMRWLAARPGFKEDLLPGLLRQKVRDYGQEERYPAGLPRVFEELPAIVESAEFRAQMTRFLPPSVVARTVDRPMFREHMVERIQGLYRLANEGLGC